MPLQRRYTQVLDAGPISFDGGARERHIEIPEGEYPTPFWLTIQPGGAVVRVDSLPWRYQGIVESITPLGTDPVVPLHHENWEAFSVGATPNASYPNGFAWTYDNSGEAVVSTDVCHTGTRSLRVRYLATTYGVTTPNRWTEVNYDLGQPYDELWYEWYIYYPANYYHSYPTRVNTGYEGCNNKFHSVWVQDNTAPNDEQEANYNVGYVLLQTWPWEARGGTPGDSLIDLNNDNSYPAPRVNPIITQALASRGRWVRFREHIRRSSTAGVTDGLVEVWVDDTHYEWPNIACPRTLPAGYSKGLRYGYLPGNNNSGYEYDTYIYIDDFTVYTTDPGW